MKKFLYFFGILALITGLVSSCSKDEDEGGNGNTAVPQKRLVKVIEFPGEDDECTNTFEYNHEGKFCFSTSKYDGKITKHSYTYEGNTLTDTATNNDDTSISIYTFNSIGYLDAEKYENKYGSGNIIYKYDNQGHLISETHASNNGPTTVKTYEWENGNVTKITELYKVDNYESTEIMTYKYKDQGHPTLIKNLGNLSILEFEDFEPIYSNIGIAPKNLPIYVSYAYTDNKSTEYDIDELSIEWVLDGQEYPTKMIKKEGDDLDYFVELFWE